MHYYLLLEFWDAISILQMSALLFFSLPNTKLMIDTYQWNPHNNNNHETDSVTATNNNQFESECTALIYASRNQNYIWREWEILLTSCLVLFTLALGINLLFGFETSWFRFLMCFPIIFSSLNWTIISVCVSKSQTNSITRRTMFHSKFNMILCMHSARFIVFVVITNVQNDLRDEHVQQELCIGYQCIGFFFIPSSFIVNGCWVFVFSFLLNKFTLDCGMCVRHI